MKSFRETLIRIGAKNRLNDYIGGFENTLLDYEEQSEEYKNAKRALEDEKQIVDVIYRELVNDPIVATPMGLVSIKKDIRFIGKERIYEIIREVYKKVR